MKLDLLYWLLNSAIETCMGASVRRHWLYGFVMNCDWLPSTDTAAADELIQECMDAATIQG